VRRVLVSLHHTHGHSGVVIGDEGVLLVRDLRSAGAGWSPLRGDLPELITWPDGQAVAGGLLPAGAAGVELVTGGRRATAVVAGGAWIAAARLEEGAGTIPVRYTGPGGRPAGEAAAGA
jgi:hypothetical protein